MLGKRQQRPEVSRSAAMAACPSPLPVKHRHEDGDGLRLEVEFSRPKWQQRLGAPSTCVRSFVLDRLGCEVYHYCNGETPVRDIIERFAGRHKVSIAEAEYSITTYLKTLISKGLIDMAVPKSDDT